MSRLILLRHGESVWNLENRFTGWTDVDLSDRGVEEARAAGRRLKAADVHIDLCFTSVLKRAIRTLWLSLEEMDRMWLPVHRHWRLNERHYGDLQGYNKAEMAEKVGKEQVHLWRRSFDIPPPALAEGDERRADHDPRYALLDPDILPATESLKDCIARVMPYWHDIIAPHLKHGENVLIAAHGNSLRGLVKMLEHISDDDIVGLEIATGTPIVYDLDAQLRPTGKAILKED